MSAYDYDRSVKVATPSPRDGKFDIRLSSGVLPTQHLLRVFIDDDQLGLLSSCQIKASMHQSLMEIRIGLLEGLSREAWEGCSPGLKESARKTAARLRSFPTVVLSCPEFI